jgi:hypothetical protein
VELLVGRNLSAEGAGARRTPQRRNEVDNLKNRSNPHDPEFLTWQRNTRATIAAVFGENAAHVATWDNRRLRPMVVQTPFSLDRDPQLDAQHFRQAMDDARAQLDAMIFEVDRYGEHAGNRAAEVPVSALAFACIRSVDHGEVVEKDYEQAQRAFNAGLYKAAALLAGGVIEQMLADALQWPDTIQRPQYSQAILKLPGGQQQQVNWERASLERLAEAAVTFGLLDATGQHAALLSRDFRDTVHPNAEVRIRRRASQEDAEVLLAVVRWLHSELSRQGTSPGR